MRINWTFRYYEVLKVAPTKIFGAQYVAIFFCLYCYYYNNLSADVRYKIAIMINVLMLRR
ncbi:hypothetical protein RhiirC2_35374 [Rhizophagus irregularis]|uniref:Uncharacterized protein n=1 Tax=Rhizophagus irregularis TaxID=588596 RepID=A0A2N1MXT6_9GLOM|nr:hypothetical protein RhiirC2_35374 [Rhizophagus irregularis]